MKKIGKIYLFIIFIVIFSNAAVAQWKIMPMGDSITKGFTGSTNSSGFRNLVLSTLTGYGYTVDFVGELPWGGTDPNTEAYQGWETTDLN